MYIEDLWTNLWNFSLTPSLETRGGSLYGNEFIQVQIRHLYYERICEYSDSEIMDKFVEG